MAIEINGMQLSATSQGNRKDSEKVEGLNTHPQKPPHARNDTADEVTITPAANILLNVENTLNRVPIIDAQRVQEIRTELADGHYKIDPHKTADNMLQFERSLFG